MRLEFDYDHKSRRVAKRVKRWDSAASVWEVTKNRAFIYDGWNLIAEFDLPTTELPASRLLRSYAWGADVSGTPQGAGGVGGLLLVTEYSATASTSTGAPAPARVLAPCYMRRGDIIAYADTATGQLVHDFEYDPFGCQLGMDSILETADDTETAPPFRYSTKYTDEETGLVYYGFRYCSPELGRWPNRDPIGERGGLNLYGMIGNDAVNRADYLGLTNFMGPPLPPSPGTQIPKTGGKGNGNCIAAACGTGGYHEPTNEELDSAKKGDPQKFLDGYNPMGNRGKCRLASITHFDNNNTMMELPCEDREREVICVAFICKNVSFEMHCIERTAPGEGGYAPAYDSNNGFDGNNVSGISDPLQHFGNTLPPARKVRTAGRATYCCEQAKK